MLANRIEKAPNVRVENPVHRGITDRHRQCIHRVVLPPPGPEPVGEAEEVFLVDRVEHSNQRTLNDFVLQRGNPQGPLLVGSRLRYEPSPNRQRPIRPAMDPVMQVQKVDLQTRLVVLPRHAVHPGRGTALERQERIPQQIDRDVVQQRGELVLLPLPCSLPYTVQPL